MNADIRSLLPMFQRIEKTGNMDFEDVEQRDLFLTNLNSLRSVGFETNVILVSSEGSSFHCHKIVLASSSTFFRAMFTSGTVLPRVYN